MTVSKLLSLGLVSGILLSLTGCAGTQRGYWRKGQVPPGVSRAVAARADSLAERLFVPLQREREALQQSREGRRHYALTDSLWTIWDALQHKRAHPSKTIADSVAGPVLTAAAGANPQTERRNGADYASTSKIRIDAIYNLKQAREKLEKSLLRDPFKPLTKHYLALTYKLFAERFPHEFSLERAVEMWSDLARLERGEYEHVLNLGNAYYAMGQWSKALTNFQIAERVLRNSAEVSRARVDNPNLPQSAWIDSTHLFSTVYYQAQSLIKRVIAEQRSRALADADSALAYLYEARALTSDAQWHALIAADITYITWDDRNIWGSALRDSARILADRGEFRKATEIYDVLLQRVLQTRRARNDVQWDYATIEYTKLKRRAAAIVRLGAVVADIAKDSSSAPIDSTYQNMFENYGAMCHFVGLDTMKVNRKVAYEYFERATSIVWQDRGRSFLQMAELTRANFELSVRHAEEALPHMENFNVDEKKNLYDLLAQGYRRKGEIEKARFYFARFRELP